MIGRIWSSDNPACPMWASWVGGPQGPSCRVLHLRHSNPYTDITAYRYVNHTCNALSILPDDDIALNLGLLILGFASLIGTSSMEWMWNDSPHALCHLYNTRYTILAQIQTALAGQDPARNLQIDLLFLE